MLALWPAIGFKTLADKVAFKTHHQPSKACLSPTTHPMKLKINQLLSWQNAARILLAVSLATSAPLQASAEASAEASPKAWQWTIPQRYQEAIPFDVTGLAMVRLAGKWGLIDKSGKQILSCTYDEIIPYPQNACFALRSGSQWGLADSSGRVILRTEWEAVQPLIRGFIPVKRFGKWGYADASGKLVIPCAWDDAWRFSPAGTAIVTKGTGNEKKRGFIDTSGRIIIAPTWDGALNHTAEGFGAVRRDSVWAFVDKEGKLLGEAKWEFTWKSLRADLGFIPVWKEKWGAIGFDGLEVIPTKWASITPGKKGVLFWKPGAPAIFIGKNGTELFTTGPWDEVSGNVAPGTWYEFETFSEGYLAVRTGDKWGLIDEEGTTVLQPAWDFIGKVQDGFVAVKNKNSAQGWQFLRTDGTPAFALPEGVQLGQNYNPDEVPRFRNGVVSGWKLNDQGRAMELTLNREGKPAEPREHAWLPEGLSIEDRRIGHVSRNGRYGYVRNFADKNGRILMTDVPVSLNSLDVPFPYPGPSQYGLATRDGKVLVEPKWDWVEAQDSGCVLVWKEGRVGVVDSKGTLVLQPKWDSVSVTENSLLRAVVGKVESVFDSSGKPVIPADISSRQYVDFYGAGCIVKTNREDGSLLWSLFDPANGAPVHFENAARVYWNRSMAENGLLWIEERDSSEWALIQRDGTPLGIRQADKPFLWEMSEGIARHTKTDGTSAFLNAKGVELGSKTWEDTNNFSNGFAAVRSGGKWGFVDKTGELVVPTVCDSVSRFQDIGNKKAAVLRAVVAIEENYGLIDNKGKWIMDPKWEQVGEYCKVGDGRWLATVSANGLCGLVDGNGTLVLEPQWEKIGAFKDYGSGRWIAEACQKGQVGFIDATGQTVVEPMGKPLEQSARYPGLLALQVEIEGSDKLQNAVFLPDGTRLEPLSLQGSLGSGGLQIRKSATGKSGLYSRSGTAIIEPLWDHMAWIAPDRLAAWTATKGALFDASGRTLLEDNATRRLARFNDSDWHLQSGRSSCESCDFYLAHHNRLCSTASPRMHKKGVVLIEAPPVWGYASFIQDQQQLTAKNLPISSASNSPK